MRPGKHAQRHRERDTSIFQIVGSGERSVGRLDSDREVDLDC